MLMLFGGAISTAAITARPAIYTLLFILIVLVVLVRAIGTAAPVTRRIAILARTHSPSRDFLACALEKARRSNKEFLVLVLL